LFSSNESIIPNRPDFVGYPIFPLRIYHMARARSSIETPQAIAPRPNAASFSQDRVIAGEFGTLLLAKSPAFAIAHTAAAD
jgi:hypothetical protein